MVRILFFFVMGLFFSSCHYVLIPPRYFKKYTKILNANNSCSLLSCEKIYIDEDTFLSRDYSKNYKIIIKSYTYIFLYDNNLIAKIRTPIIAGGKPYVLSHQELVDSVKTGYFDKNPCEIDWMYYTIENNHLNWFDFSYEPSSGVNALSPVTITKRKFLIIENGFSYAGYEERFKKEKLNPIMIQYTPIDFSSRPDPSKSWFIAMYNKYKKTGRRKYSPNRERLYREDY